MRTSNWKEISALEVYPIIFHESKNVSNAIFGEKQQEQPTILAY